MKGPNLMPVAQHARRPAALLRLPRGLVAACVATLGAAAFLGPSGGVTNAAFTDSAAARTSVTAGTWGTMGLVYDLNAKGCPATRTVTLGASGSSQGIVRWGDGTSQPLTDNATHVYGAAGKYTVTISGSFDKYNSLAVGNNAACLTEVNTWTGTKTANLENAFNGAVNLTKVPQIPSGVTSLARAFEGASSFNGDVSSWDTSQVTTMDHMFQSTPFNQPLATWDVSRVTSMWNMFFEASAFNQNINGWNTASLTRTSNMFQRATAFNQPLDNWKMSKVTDTDSMFSSATSFNQPLGAWDTSSLRHTAWMFYNAPAFNQNIDTWKMGKVTDLNGMFVLATAFNSPLNSWDTSAVWDMSSAFNQASSFNQPLNNWDTGNVTTMGSMFAYAVSFNQNLSGWNVGKVTSTQSFSMLTGANYGGWSASLQPTFP